MFTNTYLPHLGGVARSVETFARAYERLGHPVLVVAPEFEDLPVREPGVARIPAIQRFNGSDFSVALPVPGSLNEELDAFAPEIVHAHHPYLLGMTALRSARVRALPLVFTHHTRYEDYTHYVPGDSAAMKRFVVALATSYANLSNLVFAPSESIRDLLLERGVTTPVAVLPTGVEVATFAAGDGAGFRAALGVPADAFVIGHLGRLAPEKNIAFLAAAVAARVRADPRAHFLVVGAGPSAADIREAFERAGLAGRLHLAGALTGRLLASAYRAMDVFAFASKTETQGMVLVEAMAAGVPVVALDAPGAREVVRDGANGRLLDAESTEAFAAAIAALAALPPAEQDRLAAGATATAAEFSVERTARDALAHYERLRGEAFAGEPADLDRWEESRRLISAQWDILMGVASAVGAAFAHHPPRPR